MSLSIIIVNWNAKKYISECLQSIIHQKTNHEIEIIVVENASSDGSQELIRKRFPNVKLICNKENLGFAKANNIGIKNSSGKYIALINSDVKVLDGCIDQMLVYMNKHPEIGMLGPQIVDSNGKVQRSYMGFPTIWNTVCRAMALDSLFPESKLFGGLLMTCIEPITIRNVDIINGCFWIVRREALNQVGLLDDRFFMYGEDKDWCKRFWDTGWKITYFPEAKAIHYGGASSSNAPIRFYIAMQRSDLQYWQKHHGSLSQRLYIFILGLHHIIRLIGETIIYIIRPSKRINTLLKIQRNISYFLWRLGFNVNGWRNNDM